MPKLVNVNNHASFFAKYFEVHGLSFWGGDSCIYGNSSIAKLIPYLTMLLNAFFNAQCLFYASRKH